MEVKLGCLTKWELPLILKHYRYLNSFLAVAEELQIKGLTNKGSEKSSYKDRSKWARPKLSGSPISKKQMH